MPVQSNRVYTRKAVSGVRTFHCRTATHNIALSFEAIMGAIDQRFVCRLDAALHAGLYHPPVPMHGASVMAPRWRQRVWHLTMSIMRVTPLVVPRTVRAVCSGGWPHAVGARGRQAR
jgi:hypothetical protein